LNQLMDPFAEFISELTNFELLELSYTVSSRIQQSWVIFVSAFFAFLITTHLVGKKLSSLEVWTISIVYTFYSLQILMVIISDGLDALQIGARIYDVEPSSGFINLAFGVATYIVACVLSLIFMYRTRRQL